MRKRKVKRKRQLEGLIRKKRFFREMNLKHQSALVKLLANGMVGDPGEPSIKQRIDELLEKRRNFKITLCKEFPLKYRYRERAIAQTEE